MVNFKAAERVAEFLSGRNDLEPVSYGGLIHVLSVYHDDSGPGDDQECGRESEQEEWVPKVGKWCWFQPINKPAAYLVLISQDNNNYTYSFSKPHDGVLVPLKALRPATDGELYRPGAEVEYIRDKPHKLSVIGFVRSHDSLLKTIVIAGLENEHLDTRGCTLIERAPEAS